MSFLFLFCSVFYISVQSNLKTHSYLVRFGCVGLSEKKNVFQLHNLNNQNKHLAQQICHSRFVTFKGSLASLRYILKDDPEKGLNV